MLIHFFTLWKVRERFSQQFLDNLDLLLINKQHQNYYHIIRRQKFRKSKQYKYTDNHMIVFFLVALCYSAPYSIYPYFFLNTNEPNILAFGDFCPQWAVLNMLTPTPDLKTIRFYKGSNLAGTFTLEGDNRKIQGHFLNDQTSSRYFALDFSSTLRVYETQNFNLAFTSPAGVDDAVFTSQKHEIVYLVSSAQKLYKMDCTNYSVVKEQNLTQSPVQLVWSATKLLVYAIDSGNPAQGYISIYSENLTFLSQIAVNSVNAMSLVYFNNTSFPTPTNHTLSLETNGIYLVRSNWTTVQIWNITSGQLVKTKSMTEQVFDALICNQVLVVLLPGHVHFYEYGTWNYFKSVPYTFGIDVAYMKCFETSSTIGVYSPNSNLVVTYFRLIVNSSSTTPNTLSNQTNTTNITNVTSPAIVAIPTYEEHYSDQPWVLSLFMSSKDFAEKTSAVSQVVAVASAANIGPALRPFSSFIQEFVFYSYHTKVYPPIVEIFTAQADILNQLRIKPKFMQFKISDPRIDQSNQRYLAQSGFSPKRAPDIVYFPDFLKEDLSKNFLLVCAFFIAFLLFRKFAQKMMVHFPIWKFVYAYMSRKVVWWNFLVMLFSNNVRTFSFYCFVQLSIFVSFDFVDKISMVVTVLMLFLLFVFSFGFYLLVFRFSNVQLSREVLQVCKFGLSSFMIEMSLNTMRGFTQSLIHGSFANRHDLQIVGLILIDILIILTALVLRKQFSSRIVGFLIVSYLCSYLAFDVFLALYSFNHNQNYSFEKTFTIIFFSLIAITVMKTVFLMIETIIEAIKSLRKSNKVKMMKIKENKKNEINRQKIVVQQIQQQIQPGNKFDEISSSISDQNNPFSQNILLKLKPKIKVKTERQKTKN